MTETEMLERVQSAVRVYSARRAVDASHPRAADTRIFTWPTNARDVEARGASGTPDYRLELLVTIDVGSASKESDFAEIWSITFQAWLGRRGLEVLFSFTKRGAGLSIISVGSGIDDPHLPLCLDALEAHAQGVDGGTIPGWA